MTRDTRPSADDPDDAIFAALWKVAPFPELPPDAPASVKALTAEVDDPRKVYTIHRASRRHQFQLLVERYIVQLRHGCQSKHCTTATCFTCRKRLSGKVPLRRYSPTSARTLACYMASQDNPEAALCPYIMDVPLMAAGVGSVKIVAKASKAEGPSPNGNAHASNQRVPTTTGNSQSKKKAPLMASDIWRVLEDTYQSRPNEQPAPPIDLHSHLLEETKKDHKSFIQNLYNTVSMRMLEWLTPSGFGSLHATYLEQQAAKATVNGRTHTTDSGHQSNSVVGQAIEEKAKIAEPPIADLPKTNDSNETAKTTNPKSNGASPLAHTPESLGVELLEALLTRDLQNGKVEASDPAPMTERSTLDTASPSENESRSSNPSSSGNTETESCVDDTCGPVKDEQVPNSTGANPPPLYKPPETLRLLNIELVEFLCDVLQEDVTAERHLLQPPRVTRNMQRLRSPRMKRVSASAGSRTSRKQWKLFIEQSLYYVLSDPQRLLQSFGEPSAIDSHSLWYCMLRLTRVEPSLVFHSLWMAAESLFAPPSGLDLVPRSRSVSSNVQGLSPASAARLLFICITALIAAAPLVENPEILFDMSRSRSRSQNLAGEDDVELALHYVDIFSDEMALRLARRLFSAVITRMHFQELMATSAPDHHADPSRRQQSPGILEGILRPLFFLQVEVPPVLPFVKIERTMHEKRMPTLLLDWARTIMIQDWNGSPVVPVNSSFGGALLTISEMFACRGSLLLGDVHFRTDYFEERLDVIVMPVEWMSFVPNKKTVHLLNHPFLFRPSTLISYFRAINYSRMNKAHELSSLNTTQVNNMASPETFFGNSSRRRDLFDRLQTAVSKFLVLKIRRDNVLRDAFDQIWRREERELTRPLKVRLGEDEGEEGSDSGGVQQEFFRLVLAEALNPDSGLFTVDERTKMTWFQPGSPEPLWKFELIGVLFALAVFNGLTLPVTFPLAFYQKLLGLPVSHLWQIEDGWPDLSAGFTTLLEWDSSAGAIEDVFARTYEFSVSMFGEPISRDMSDATEWPQFGSSRDSNPTDAKLVTEENREAYVRDYIAWLTDVSIRAQYNAFERGFYTVIDPRSVKIFTAEIFKSLVEGVQEISITELRQYARYVGWDADHPVVKDFWKIVGAYDLEQRRKLLEFVTASDRVPVGGMRAVQFVIQRNGDGDSRLPSAYTCYGTLLLPEYKTQSALREKLTTALENAKGFGFA